MVKFFLLLSLISTQVFSTVEIPREGTQTLLSPSEVADLRQWIENAKNDLAALEDETRLGNLEDRRRRITQEFEAIVSRSAKKENELLTRYTLNRSLEIDELLGADPAPSELQSLVAFLDSTLRLAKGFYTDDQKYLEAMGRGDKPELQTPMPVFAYQYAEMILAFSRTFIRPELEYSVTFKALGWLANDLNSSRNLDRVQYADSILRIERLQKKFSENNSAEIETVLNNIRLFKWEYRERILLALLSLLPNANSVTIGVPILQEVEDSPSMESDNRPSDLEACKREAALLISSAGGEASIAKGIKSCFAVQALAAFKKNLSLRWTTDALVKVTNPHQVRALGAVSKHEFRSFCLEHALKVDNEWAAKTYALVVDNSYGEWEVAAAAKVKFEEQYKAFQSVLRFNYKDFSLSAALSVKDNAFALEALTVIIDKSYYQWEVDIAVQARSAIHVELIRNIKNKGNYTAEALRSAVAY